MSLGAYSLRPGDALLEAVAAWPVRFHVEPNAAGHLTHPGRQGAHLRCAACAQSVACLTPDLGAGSYALSLGGIQAGILAHLKVSHEDALPRT